MEKMSLKNIKIILISIIILVFVVLVLRLQIASTNSKKRANEQLTVENTQPTQDQSEEEDNYYTEEPEEDIQDSTQNQEKV